MLWVTIFVALVISLAVILYVVRPLIDRTPAPVYVEDDRLTDLLSRKDAVLRAIKDLEFDRNVGKLEAADFERFNQSLSRQALGLMQQIEKIAPSSTQHDDVLEQEIIRLRKTVDHVAPAKVPPVKVAPVKETPVKETLAKETPAKVAERVKKTVPSSNGLAGSPAASKAKFCTECGQPVEANHKFCANCGASLA